MCGRFTCDLPEAMLIEYFNVPAIPDSYRIHYNIVPSQSVLAIRQYEDKRQANMLRWGFVPGWQKAEEIGSKFINARAETAAEKPMFKYSFKQRRCIIVASGFYEWQTTEAGKQPIYIYPANKEPMPIAGLWTHWEGEGIVIHSCTILTTPATKAIHSIHDRMPVILQPNQFADWLSPENQDLKVVSKMITAANQTKLAFHPVSKLVNSPANDSAECIEEVQA